MAEVARGGQAVTRIGVVGCGYVFDHYMSTFGFHTDLQIVGLADRDPERLAAVQKFGLPTYASLSELLAAQEVDLVLNLTSIDSHDEVIREALLADKPVYTEKPVTLSLESTQSLFDLAAERGLALVAAPCNVFSDSVQTMWKAVRDGAIGTPRLVYAEFDDNPVYLMAPEGWRSASGAPWPYLHEYEVGCTVEHAGYHLTWMCALFGPARSVTAFSQVVLPDKTDQPLHPADAADFSVAVIAFESGVVARLTNSIAAPADHRMRVIGNEGELHTNTYRNYHSPVFLERFSKLSMNARKSRSVRTKPALGQLLGVGGKQLPLVRSSRSDAVKGSHHAGQTGPKALVHKVKRREIGAQDKCLGVAIMADALRDKQPQPLPPEFHLHITELTLAIQNAGPVSTSHVMTTTFAPIQPLPSTVSAPGNVLSDHRSSLLARASDRLIDNLHKH